jgi:hypothetical protein
MEQQAASEHILLLAPFRSTQSFIQNLYRRVGRTQDVGYHFVSSVCD